jgi:DNA glycosylase AlkZ-like
MIAERLTAQLLAGPRASDPVAATNRLLAVASQDLRGARLAIRARTEGLTAADVDHALTADRSLVVSWLNRGTLHLVRSEDYPWLHALMTPSRFTANARRLREEGVTPEAAECGVAVIERSLAEDGPLSRAQLGERIAAAGVRTEGQALVHVLMLASLRGLIVRGPIIGGGHAYVLVRDWLGKGMPLDRDRALAELARRYLVGHGPADVPDLAKWAGLSLRDARAGYTAIAAELETRADGLVDLAARPPAAPLPKPRLLGPFDPLLLGWRSRSWVLDSHEATVVRSGMIRPIALVGGRAAATWTLPANQVVFEPFRRLARKDATALEADAADVVRYLGGT